METHKKTNSQNNLNKEEQSWKTHTSHFKTYKATYSNQASVILAQE